MYFRDFVEFPLTVRTVRIETKNIDALSVVPALRGFQSAHKVFFKACGEPQ
jgi:hypothetical protein